MPINFNSGFTLPAIVTSKPGDIFLLEYHGDNPIPSRFYWMSGIRKCWVFAENLTLAFKRAEKEVMNTLAESKMIGAKLEKCVLPKDAKSVLNAPYLSMSFVHQAVAAEMKPMVDLVKANRSEEKTGSYEAVGDKFDTIRAAFARTGTRVLPATPSQPPQIKMNVIRAGETISRPVAAWSNNGGSLSLKPALYGKDVLLAVESARGIHIADADPIIKSVMHTPTWKGEAKIAESHYNLKSSDNRFTAI